MDKEFDLFFRANEGRIHYQLRRLGISGEWYEEFYADGLVAMWQAFREYDAGKGKLGTFVNYRIRFRLIDLMRRKMREQKAREAVVQEHGLRLTDGNLHRATGLPVISGHGVELLDDAFWEEVRGRLTENQWKWVHYFIIVDLSVKEIMELEGVSADAVKGWGRAVRDKLGQEELRGVLEGLV